MDSSLSHNDGYPKSSYSDPGYETQNGGYFPLDPVDGYDDFGGSEGYRASHGYPAVASPVGGGAPPGWGPPQTTAGTSNVRLSPQQFHAGQLLRSEAVHEDGDSESETQERYRADDLTSTRSTPYYGFQPGELTNVESFHEGGNYEGETRAWGSRPDQQTEEEWQTAESVGEAGPALSPAAAGNSVLSSLHNLLLLYNRGQLYPGTMHHYASEYVEGEDEREEVQRQRYGFYWCVPHPYRLNIAAVLIGAVAWQS